MLRSVIIYTSAAIFAIALMREYYRRGGPYFEIPQTIEDHVRVGENATREVILLCRRVAPLLPRGAEVTIVIPSQNPNFDATIYLIGVGMLPHQQVFVPDAHLPRQYVLTIREPLDWKGYRLVAQFPEGRLYSYER